MWWILGAKNCRAKALSLFSWNLWYVKKVLFSLDTHSHIQQDQHINVIRKSLSRIRRGRDYQITLAVLILQVLQLWLRSRRESSENKRKRGMMPGMSGRNDRGSWANLLMQENRQTKKSGIELWVMINTEALLALLFSPLRIRCISLWFLILPLLSSGLSSFSISFRVHNPYTDFPVTSVSQGSLGTRGHYGCNCI